MIRCVTSQSRKKILLRINTVGHNKIFTMFYNKKKNAKKICTYHNIFSSPLALIPSGMWYRPNNLKTKQKSHCVISCFSIHKLQAKCLQTPFIQFIFPHYFPYLLSFLKIWQQRNEILGTKPGLIGVIVKTILKSSAVNLQS